MIHENHKSATEALFALFARRLDGSGYRLGYEGVPPISRDDAHLHPAVFKRESTLARCARYVNGKTRREGTFSIRLYTDGTDTAARRHACTTLWMLAEFAASGAWQETTDGMFALLSPDSAPCRMRYEREGDVWEMRFVYRLQ